MSAIGHNSGIDRYADLITRIEKVSDERDEAVAEFRDTLRDLRTEAKSAGYDIKAISEHLRRRKWAKKNKEADDVLGIYEGVLL